SDVCSSDLGGHRPPAGGRGRAAHQHVHRHGPRRGARPHRPGRRSDVLMLRTTVLAAEGADVPEGIELFFPPLSEIIFSALALGILAWVFLRKVLPTFTKILDERTERIEGGLAKAEAAQEEAARALAEYHQQLNQARAEAQRIREEARAEGAQIV